MQNSIKCQINTEDFFNQLALGGLSQDFPFDLHNTLKNDHLVLLRSRRQRGQAFNVSVRGHVFEVMASPHWFGQTFPTLHEKQRRQPQISLAVTITMNDHQTKLHVNKSLRIFTLRVSAGSLIILHYFLRAHGNACKLWVIYL